MRRVHYEYQGYSIGYAVDQEYDEVSRVNFGRGIEFAPENAVVDAIVQEFMSSKLTYGYIRGMKDQSPRYYVIEREQPYVSNPTQKADIMLKRVNRDDLTGDAIKPPSIIEAKRAFLWDYAMSKNDVRVYTERWKAVNADIDRLQQEIKATKNSCICDRRLGHILVWGTYDYSKTGTPSKAVRCSTLPHEFYKKLMPEALEGPNVRWMPLTWSIERGCSDPPAVVRWLWLLLAEVKQES